MFMCQNKFIEQFDNAHSLKKHKVMLSKCENYIESLSVQGVSHDFYQQASQFAIDTYNELERDDLLIVRCNTSSVPRNIDALSNLRINLNAIHRMLEELITKESKALVQDMKDDIAKN